MLKEVKCNICNSDSYRILYKASFEESEVKKSTYMITNEDRGIFLQIVRCSRCGLIYACPRPAVSSLLTNYVNFVDATYVEEEEGRRIAARAILKMLKKLKKRGKLLDTGCATGFLLDEAKRDGWQVYGVELSKWAIDYAKDKLGIEDIFQGTLKRAAYPDNYFDAVVLKDTIEHLTNPKATLIEIRRILRPDGILCVNTPNIGSLISRVLKAKWWGVKQSHLYYFSRKSLYKMLNAAGFVPIKCRAHARTFTIRYWARRLSGYNKVLYKILSFLMKYEYISNRLIRINLGDQIEVFARKSRSLKYLEELERPIYAPAKEKMKTVVVLPAYNAAKTLRRTVEDIPKDVVDEIILVDDASKDNTVSIAKNLGLEVFTHSKNKGYGANQKTCYQKALEMDADIVVMVHPDYQYDPKVISELIKPIEEGRADAVFGSRMMKGGAFIGGMPLWKHNANILLTALENVVLGTYLTEYHSGFRAYSAKYLKSVNFMLNSDGFIFDTEIIVQGLVHYMRIEEIPIRTRYFDEASSIRLWSSIIYGLGIFKTLFKYTLHINGIIRYRQFE